MQTIIVTHPNAHKQLKTIGGSLPILKFHPYCYFHDDAMYCGTKEAPDLLYTLEVLTPELPLGIHRAYFLFHDSGQTEGHLFVWKPRDFKRALATFASDLEGTEWARQKYINNVNNL